MTGGAGATTPISSCGTISSPGEYALTTNIIFSHNATCISITSSDVTFDGAGYTIGGQGSTNTYGVYVFNPLITLTNVIVKNLKVTLWQYGIYYLSSQNGIIYNNIANSNNYGIYLNSSSNNTLSGNNASSNGYGIYLNSSSNNTLSGNKANSNTGGGIFLVSSSSNTLSGNNASNNGDDGISLDSSSDNTLSSNNANSNTGGIVLSSSSNITLSGNNANLNNAYGIILVGSNNTLSGNNANSNNGDGIFLVGSDNTLSGNNASNNSDGITLVGSGNNTLSGNNASFNNFSGISLGGSNNTLSGNNASFNNFSGFSLSSSSNSTLSGNNANSNNGDGIFLFSSSNNTLSNNNASFNNFSGISLVSSSNNNNLTSNNANSNTGIGGILVASSSNNSIYNNFFNNTNNFVISNSVNRWNITKTGGKNIIGGAYLGGNFWAKPDGTGFSQTCTDSNSDGICDSSNTLATNNIDYLPLTNKLIPPPPITVTSPNGGENWIAGTTKVIRWTYTGNPGTSVKIELLKGGVLKIPPIAFSASIGSGGNGSYTWHIPAFQTSGTDYKVRITSTTKSIYNDTSDANFAISAPPAPTINVTSPNGGENWKRGTTHMITWNYTGSPGANVKIELLKGGVLKSIIKFTNPMGSGGPGSYPWNIPASLPPGADYRVRITSTTSMSIKDNSDNNFTIS